MAITQSTPIKLTVGAVVGGIITLGIWAWNKIDARVDSKADAASVNELVKTVADHSRRLTEDEARAIELKTRREIDDRETAEFKVRYASDQAEVKASLRRIEDALLGRRP